MDILKADKVNLDAQLATEREDRKVAENLIVVHENEARVQKEKVFF